MYRVIGNNQAWIVSGSAMIMLLMQFNFIFKSSIMLEVMNQSAVTYDRNLSNFFQDYEYGCSGMELLFIIYL